MHHICSQASNPVCTKNIVYVEQTKLQFIVTEERFCLPINVFFLLWSLDRDVMEACNSPCLSRTEIPDIFFSEETLLYR